MRLNYAVCREGKVVAEFLYWDDAKRFAEWIGKGTVIRDYENVVIWRHSL